MKKNMVKRMFSAAKKENVLELFIYSEIGEGWYGDGITPQSVTNAIKEAGKIDSITVHLNSPGGASFDGVAIHNVIRQQGVPVNVIVEGLAASAAFTIAMSGDSIKVCDGAMMMLHNAWSISIGDAKQMRTDADLLDKVSGTLRDVYAKRAGMVVADVQALMDAETWLTADEAVQHGFATAKLDTTPTKEAAALAASFDLSKFCAKVPAAIKAKLQSAMADDEEDGEGETSIDDAEMQECMAKMQQCAAECDRCASVCQKCIDECNECSNTCGECISECKTAMKSGDMSAAKSAMRRCIAECEKCLAQCKGCIAECQSCMESDQECIDECDKMLSGDSGASAATRKLCAQNDNACECDCDSCQSDDCENCSNMSCTDPNCADEKMKAQRRMRLRLAEVTAPIQ